MKKLIALVLALVMALALAVPALAAEEKPEMKVGMLELLAQSEQEINDVEDEYSTTDEAEAPLKENDVSLVYYHSLAELLMALDAGYIDLAQADDPTVRYVLSRNDAYAEEHPEVEHVIAYSMLFLEEDAALCDSFNEAITAMKEDGTLDELAAEYIDGVIAGEDPDPVAFPTFEGAETVTVAVTGDVPPMDYADDTGHAAGFNTAVLAEIAQRLEVNIALVQVDSGARTLALSSGRADAAFWARSAAADPIIEGLDIPEGTITSEPYYSAVQCSLVLAAE